MAMPEINMDEDLEALDADSMDSMEEETPLDGEDLDIDPMFAADVAEAFPDLDDAQIAALQRAFLGLISLGG